MPGSAMRKREIWQGFYFGVNGRAENSEGIVRWWNYYME